MNFNKNFLIFGFLVALFFPISATVAETFNFYRNLKIGDYGQDVKSLQIFLNSDPETQVAISGVGSLGNETEYFGTLTKNAVSKFQNKYKNEILIPLGLVYPTGFVGNSTLAKMALFQNQNQNQNTNNNENFVSQNQNTPIIKTEEIKTEENQPVFQGVPTNIQPISNNISKPLNLFGVGYDNGYTVEAPAPLSVNNQSVTVSPTPASNINLENFEQIKSLVLQVGREQNFSEKDLELAVQAVRDNLVSTTTNFMKEFENQMRETNSVAMEKENNFFSGFLKQIGLTFSEIFASKTYAFGLSFGGMVLSPMFCTCSGNWLVTMIPYKPGGPALITHYMGAQMYLNMNFPFSRYVLGFYIPQGSPCMMIAFPSCIMIPSQGMTTMRIGSA